MNNPFTSHKRQLLIVLLTVLPLLTHAATIALNANDGLGTSSYNTGLHWVGGAAPSAGNDYDTAGFFMRTPGDGVTNSVFGGGSLTLGPANLSGGVNGSILEKFTGGAGSSRWLTINNLTNQANAMLRSGGTAGALIHVQGNHYTIAGTSSIWADQCIWVIDAPLLGGDSVILTNFANNANDHVSYTANNSGFTGSWYLTGAGTTAWSLQLESLNCLPGNPSTSNPGQITFLGGGQLRDIVGCTYNNANGGITLAANGTINVSATTIIGVPITDLTNSVSSISRLTSTGTGTLVLSNANNNYSGGTTISAGTLQLGVDNAIPGNSVAGDVTDNATLDLNGHNAIINGLNGAGTVDTFVSGTPTLTVGANGNSGTFSGTIQNSSGTLSLTKVGAGTQTLSGGYTFGGQMVAAGGTLSLVTSGQLPGTAGSLIVSNGGTLTVDASIGTPLPVNSLVVGANSTLNVTLSTTANGINAAGSLTFQNNATNTFNYGTLSANPTVLAIDAASGISAPGANIVINITGLGFKSGTFPVIKYTGAALGSIANFSLNLPPGVVGALVNNTGNNSIDVNITSTPNQLAWNGVNGNSWDLTTANWTNLIAGGITVFQQYTNGSVIAGDTVVLDDSLTNDFVNPQPTNINLTAKFYVFPFTVDSTLPYSISGAGGILGPTSLVKSNTGSLTLNTSNSYAGGTFVYGGTLAINNDSALGIASGPLTLNGGNLQINGNSTNNVRPISLPATATIGVAAGATARLGGVISGVGGLTKIDTGTLTLATNNTYAGNTFVKAGTMILESGAVMTSPIWDSIGQDGSDNGTLTLRGTAIVRAAGDFNIGDLDTSVGTVNIQDTAVLGVNSFYIASANNAGSTAVGTVNQTGGSVFQTNSAVGTFAVGGRLSADGVGTYNLSGGIVTATAGIRVGGAGTGTFNQSGGTVVANGGINVARLTGSTGTYNLNGGLFRTLNIASSTGSNAVFNLNGGTILPTTNAATTTFFQGLSGAFVRNGGAIIDVTNLNLTVAQPLLHSTNVSDAAIDGGLTKRGSGTLTLSGVNTFTGPITNAAGTLVLNSASTYAGAVAVNVGTLQMTTASIIRGATVVSNNATLSIIQNGSATATISNLTLNGAASGLGATLGLTITSANNPNVALVNCGTLTLNGTNTISLAAVNVGTLALVKYVGTIAGSGNCTNISLPQGATGFVSNNAAGSTLYAVITSTGPGLVWTGTNSISPNVWNIGTTTNWLVGSTPTSYHQIITPGDAVTFSDVGSGTVILNTSVAPAGVVISNNSKIYAFNGSGNISGTTGLQKLGSNTAILSVTNNTYTGDTVISNGTLQVGGIAAVSPTANLVIGPGGTLGVAGFNQTVGELTGSGLVDNNSGLDMLLRLGSGSGGTWNGNIQDHGGGGVALIKNGAGTWVVGGVNRLNNGSPFTTTNQFNGGTTIITNGGSILASRLQTIIAYGGTANVIVAGGSLAVSNDVLAVGYSAGATGTLRVNSGTVLHGGGAGGSFGNPNNLIVGAVGATGVLTVNGGQVLNSQALWLGQNATGSGTLQLNGGLVQATVVAPNNAPATSIANFNGGTLQASAASADFIQSTAMVQSNGLVLDDGGFIVTLVTSPLQEDPLSTGGGLVKQGAGTVYLDNANTYTGTTVVSAGTLAGVGSINGPVVVSAAGRLGAGDAAGLGTLILNSQPLTIQGTAALRISKDGGTPVSDSIVGISSATYGGTLLISNVTSDATPLALGDTFSLFSAAAHSGNFASISGSPAAGLYYTFNPATGVLGITNTAPYPPEPPPLTFGVSGGSLTLSWPSAYQGYILQSQTNSLTVGVGNNWVDVSGSTAVTSTIIPISPANPTVFFRLRHP